MNKPQIAVSNEIKIEKGVPLPPRQRSKYPFAEMEVGDSCFVPFATSGVAARVVRLRPRKFTSRVATEGGVKGTRVWRIA